MISVRHVLCKGLSSKMFLQFTREFLHSFAKQEKALHRKCTKYSSEVKLLSMKVHHNLQLLCRLTSQTKSGRRLTVCGNAWSILSQKMQTVSSLKFIRGVSFIQYQIPWFISASMAYYIWNRFSPSNAYFQPISTAKCEAFLDEPITTSSTDCNQYDQKNQFLIWLVQDFIPLTLRATQLLCTFTPLLITYPVTYLGPQVFDAWLWLLYVAVEHSGATFIKLGQWASTRRDLFSQQVCDRFSQLHFQVRPHSWSHTARVLQEAFGDGWQDMLHLQKGQRPIGSGCIAQVYKGYLCAEKANHPGSESMSVKNSSLETDMIPVAIKVLHPSIRSKFKRDLILMEGAARALTWLFPKLHWINLSQCVQDFSVVMEAQLDMHQECLSLQKFAKDFASFDEIHVPKVFPSLVRHNILVESYEEGISVGDILKHRIQTLKFCKQLANIGVEALLQMVFVNNFVHADLHPGNLIVQNMNKFDEQIEDTSDLHFDEETLEDFRQEGSYSGLRLVLLDCGITATLGPEDRLKFREVFTAVVKGDGETVADLFLSKSAVNNCANPSLFRKEMAQLVRDARQSFVSISKIKVAELMNAVFDVLSKHSIQLEANFATIILAMAMLEGLGRSLNPDLDLLEKARPLLLGSQWSTNRSTT